MKPARPKPCAGRRALKIILPQLPFFHEEKIVEADETYIGNKYKRPFGQTGYNHKEKVFSLVERGGKVRSQHVQFVNTKTLVPILKAQVSAETVIMTDDVGQYRFLKKDFKDHKVIAHSRKEYGKGIVHTNTMKASLVFLSAECAEFISIAKAITYSAICVNLILDITPRTSATTTELQRF